MSSLFPDLGMAPPAAPPGLGAPPAPEAPEPPVEEASEEANPLERAIQLLIQAHSEEDDPEDAAAISQVEAKLRAIIAKRAKEKDTAMGFGPKEKHVRRMTRSY
jgi:hypothetical protein